MKHLIIALTILLCASTAWGRMGMIVVGGGPGGGGGASYSDNFNRDNENPIDSPWASSMGFDHVIRIVSQKVQMATAGEGIAYYNATVAANQFSQILVPQTYNGVQYAAGVRTANGPKQGYIFIRDGESSVRIGGWNNGSWLGTLGSCSGIPSFTGGATMRLEVSGSNLVGKVNDTTYCTATDSTISGGYPFVWLQGLNEEVDDWAGGDL